MLGSDEDEKSFITSGARPQFIKHFPMLSSTFSGILTSIDRIETVTASAIPLTSFSLLLILLLKKMILREKKHQSALKLGGLLTFQKCTGQSEVD